MSEIRDLDDPTRAVLLLHATALRPVNGDPAFVRVRRSYLGENYAYASLNPGRNKFYRAIDDVAATARETESTDAWDALAVSVSPAPGRDKLVTLHRPEHDAALWESLLEEITGRVDWTDFLRRHNGSDIREPITARDSVQLRTPTPLATVEPVDTDWTVILHRPGATKICSRCQEVKPADAFGIREGLSAARLESRCRACKSAAATEAARRARDRRREQGLPGRFPRPVRDEDEQMFSGGPAGW